MDPLTDGEGGDTTFGGLKGVILVAVLFHQNLVKSDGVGRQGHLNSFSKRKKAEAKCASSHVWMRGQAPANKSHPRLR